MNHLKWPVVGLAVVVVLGTGGYAVARSRDSGASYSTATAARGDVERTLDLSGTVTATGRRDLAFGTAGTVSSVAVTSGRRVGAGQVLARLDRTALDASVTSAVATLAKAQAQLASDQDAQATTVSTASTATTSGAATARTSGSTPRTKSASSSSGKPASPPTDPALQQALAALAQQQRAVTTAQTAAGTAITAAKSALAAQAEKCRVTAGDPGDPGGGSDDGSDDTAPTGSGVSTACSEALAGVQAAQDAVAEKQDQLQAALETLAGTLGKAVTTVQRAAQSASRTAAASATEPAQSATPSAGQSAGQSAPTGQTGSAAPSPTAGSGASGRTITAATLAKDQADIDTARAQLTQARAERRLAVLRAPYAGRVLQVDVAKGDQVSASDIGFVLVGAGVTTVTATVTAAQVPSVRRGQDVSVTPAGWTRALRGTVTEIGLLPDDSSSYPVTITVPSGRTVAEGSTASVSVVTGAAQDVVTVPTSAVTRTGTRASVRVLSGQTVTRTVVTLGVVGTRRAAVTTGLDAGDTVVLADLGAALPSSDSTQGNRQRFAGGSGFGPGAGGGPTTRVGGR